MSAVNKGWMAAVFMLCICYLTYVAGLMGDSQMGRGWPKVIQHDRLAFRSFYLFFSLGPFNMDSELGHMPLDSLEKSCASRKMWLRMSNLQSLVCRASSKNKKNTEVRESCYS